VLAAVGKQMVDHRGPEFAAVLRSVTSGLKRAFRTDSDVLAFTCAGTGGLEAAVVNSLSPGQKVLSVSIGEFGKRFAAFSWLQGLRATFLAVGSATGAHDQVRNLLATITSTVVANELHRRWQKEWIVWKLPDSPPPDLDLTPRG